jgi:hypothetical protein
MNNGTLKMNGESGERYEVLPTGTVKRDGRPVGTISLESYSLLAARFADAQKKGIPVSVVGIERKTL